MVTTSGFTHTPATRALILTVVLLSVISSTLSLQHYLPIRPTPHLWPYLQFSRLLTYQVAYTSSTDLLFAVALLYQFRVLERLWGSRKFTSFVAVVFFMNLLVTPFLVLVCKLGSLGWYNYLPAGLTGLAFALLAAWAEEVPRIYRYKIASGSGVSSSASSSGSGTSGSNGGATEGSEAPGVVLSDKSTTYLLAAQLALSQFPYSILPAAVGWIVGTAWMSELLPGGLGRWRVPAWMVGETSSRRERGQFEGLRRRLEEEGGAADGMRNVTERMSTSGDREDNARRGLGSRFVGYFTGS